MFNQSQDLVSLAVHTVALIPTLVILLLIFRLPPASLPGSQVFRHTILVATLAAVSFFSLPLSLAKLIVNDTCYTGALKVLISLNSDLCQSSPSSAPSTESSSECSRRSSESSSPI